MTEARICERCEGLGLTTIDDEEVRCPDCRGAGRIDEHRPAPDSHPLGDTLAPAHQLAWDTEIEARRLQLPKAGTVKRQMLRAYIRAGEAGMTDHEMHRHLEWLHQRPRAFSGIMPARAPLVEADWLTAGPRRIDPQTKAPNIAWRITEAGRAALPPEHGETVR